MNGSNPFCLLNGRGEIVCPHFDFITPNVLFEYFLNEASSNKTELDLSQNL